MKKFAILFTGLVLAFINVSFAYAAEVTPQKLHDSDSNVQIKSLLYDSKELIQSTETSEEGTKECYKSKCDESCVIKHEVDKPDIKIANSLYIFNIVLISIVFLFLLIFVFLLFWIYIRIRKLKKDKCKKGDKNTCSNGDKEDSHSCHQSNKPCR